MCGGRRFTGSPDPIYHRLRGPLRAATFNGRRRSLTTAALLRSFFALPLVTFKVVAAIHWEALHFGSRAHVLRHVRMPQLRTPPSTPAWRPANAMLILARCCPRAAEVEASSIVCAKPWRHII
jgi:hypothetical protein